MTAHLTTFSWTRMINTRTVFSGVLLIALVFWMVGGASAENATISVGSHVSCTYANLQEAVNNANSGDTILVEDLTFIGANSTVNIKDKSLTIIGGQFKCNGGDSFIRTKMQADFQADTIFELTDATASRTVELRNFELFNAVGDGTGGGVEIGDRYAVTLQNVDVYDNSADSGGGVRISGSAADTARTSLTLIDSQLYGHSVTGNGGGVWCENARVTLQDGAVVSDNSADSNGGGFYANRCHVEMFGSAEIGSNSASNGGGLFIFTSSTLHLDHPDATIIQNSATTEGGGVYLSDSSLLAQQGHVDQNDATIGGGVAAYENALVIFYDFNGCTQSRCLTLSGNVAGQNFGDVGGGVFAENSRVSLGYVTIDDNYAYSGAAIFIETDNNFGASAPLLLVESTLIGRNIARSRAVVEVINGDADEHSVQIVGTTFAYNKTQFQQGDLLDLRLDGDLHLTLTGAVVRGHESEDGISTTNGVTTAVTCSVLPFGWNFSALENVIGRQDVQFRDVENDDFRVLPTSPAVDICGQSTGGHDLLGHSRPVDMPADFGNQTISSGAYDAGAFEFGGLFGLNGQPCAYATIEEAIAATNAGDRVFGLPIEHEMVIGTIDKHLSIQPSGAEGCEVAHSADDRLTFDVLDIGFDTNIMTVTAQANVTVTQTTLLNGYEPFDSGGNVRVRNGATLTMYDSVVANGSAGTNGGGIHVDNAGLWLFDTQVIGSRAFNSGAAIYAHDSSVTLDDGSRIGGNAFSDANIADNDGGGVAIVESILTVRGGSRIVNNEAVFGNGGGIFAERSRVTVQAATQLLNNIAGEDGGGLYMTQLSDLSLVDSFVTTNTAVNGGGLTLAEGSQAVLSGTSVVSDNVLDVEANTTGGGIFLTGSGLTGVLTATDTVEITRNAANSGGGVFVRTGRFVLTESAEVHDNSARRGGGIVTDTSGTVHILGTTDQRPSVYGNNATLEGGGLLIRSQTDSRRRSLISSADVYSNTALNGGGIIVLAQEVEIINTVFENNQARRGGGMWVLGDATVTVSAATEVANRIASCDPHALPASRYCSEFVGNGGDNGAAILIDGGTVTFTQTAVTVNQGEADSTTVEIRGDDSTVTFDTLLFKNNTNADSLITLEDEPTVTLRNSTLYANDGTTIDAPTAGLLRIDRSIIWDNERGVNIAPFVPFVSFCNTSQLHSVGSQTFNGAGDSNADPLLFTTARGDVYPAINSPAVDACSDGHAVDLLGQNRPIDADDTPSGSEFDKGAFEVNADLVPTAVGLNGISADAPHALWMLFGALSSVTLLCGWLITEPKN